MNRLGSIATTHTQLRQLPFSCRARPRLGPVCAQEQTQQQEQKKDLVRSLPPVRPAAPPPEAVAVEHSSSYLYRQRRQEASSLAVQKLGEDPDAPLPWFSSSDRSWREDARDVNTTAASGIASVAKVTANVSTKVLSVAVPVGGWALRQGFKAAKGALKRNSSKQPGSSQRSRRQSADDSD